MRDNETMLWGDDDTQPEDETDIGEQPTLRWLRITYVEPAPVTQRVGSSTTGEPKQSSE